MEGEPESSLIRSSMSYMGELQSHKLPLPQDITVSAFFTEERKWNSDLLLSCFTPFGVNAILQVPIDVSDRDDQIFWCFIEDIIFSVKSGYLTEIGYYEAHPTMAEENMKEWNDLIWSLQVPPKV